MTAVREGRDGAEGDFDTLSHVFAHDNLVFFPDKTLNCRGQGVTRKLERSGAGHTTERDDRDVGRPAADVHNHAAHGVEHGQTRSYCRGDGLFNELHVAGSGLCSRFGHGTALHIRDVCRHTDDHIRFYRPAADDFFRNVAMSACAASKSAMTPSRRGRMVEMRCGVFPI